MKGLIIKDLINLKRQAKVIIFLMAFYIFLAITSENSSMFSGIVTVFCAILPITALSYDEKAKWDKYALTMPVSRRDMVISKYLLGGIFFLAAFIINFAFNIFTSDDTINVALLISLAFSGVGILFLSFLLPVIFKYGVEKGRLLMFAILFIPTGLIVLFSKLGLELPSKELLYYLAYISPIFYRSSLDNFDYDIFKSVW